MSATTAIYVHIPFCKKRCSYCAFFSSCDYSQADAYFDAINRQIDDYATEYGGRAIDTIYLGGGTPSSVDNKHIDSLFNTIYSRFKVDSNAEITVECNPESINAEKIRCLQTNGVNRLSLGLQSANDQTLKLIGRLHTYKDFLNAVDMAVQAGIQNINTDIMIGLPEKHSDFVNTIESVVKLPVTHISMYGLEVYENTQLFRDIESKQIEQVCNSDTLVDWYDDGRSILQQNGFDRYEVSNFCKFGFESRHNIHYWHCDEYFGFGASAHGFLNNSRYENASSIAEYTCGKQIAASQVLTKKDNTDEFVMLSLRLERGLNLASFKQLFKADFFELYTGAKQLLQQGYLIEKEGNVAVCPNKFYVLNSILTELL